MLWLQLDSFLDLSDSLIVIAGLKESAVPEMNVGVARISLENLSELFERRLPVRLHRCGHGVAQLQNLVPFDFRHFRRQPGSTQARDSSDCDDFGRLAVQTRKFREQCD